MTNIQNSEYLEFVKSQKYYVKGLDEKPLYEYYVEQDAIPTGASTWDWEYMKFDQESRRPIGEIIRDFLEKDKRRWYMVIAAPFGIGKTSVARMIASNYASKYLYADKTAITFEDNGSRYIPILVFLGKGLDNVYNQDDLNFVLNDIVVPSTQANTRKILLILDALDEYPDQANVGKLLNDTLKKELRNKYPNMKVIITTRLKAGFSEELKIDDYDNKYVRLLPFTKEQVNQFFDRYGINLTYQDLVEIGLKEEEITKPLLDWMISRTPEITEDLQQIKFKEELTSNMTKSLIYLIFFHYIVKGKYVDPHREEDKDIIIKYYLDYFLKILITINIQYIQTWKN